VISTTDQIIELAYKMTAKSYYIIELANRGLPASEIHKKLEKTAYECTRAYIYQVAKSNHIQLASGRDYRRLQRRDLDIRILRDYLTLGPHMSPTKNTTARRRIRCLVQNEMRYQSVEVGQIVAAWMQCCGIKVSRYYQRFVLPPEQTQKIIESLKALLGKDFERCRRLVSSKSLDKGEQID